MHLIDKTLFYISIVSVFLIFIVFMCLIITLVKTGEILCILSDCVEEEPLLLNLKMK